MMPKIISILVVIFLCTSFANALFSQIKEEFVYDGRGKRDPFIPLITLKMKFTTGLLEDAQTVEDVVLEGIVWDRRGDSIAVLNGVIMKEGQEVGNVRIKRIEEKSVTIFINEVEYEIYLIKKGDETGEEE